MCWVGLFEMGVPGWQHKMHLMFESTGIHPPSTPSYDSVFVKPKDGSSTTLADTPFTSSIASKAAATLLLPEHGCPQMTMRLIVFVTTYNFA